MRGSPRIRQRISGPVGEQACTQGPAQAEAVIGFRRGAGRWIDTRLLQNGAARRGQVGREPVFAALAPGSRGGTRGPILLAGRPAGPMVPPRRSLPRCGEGPLRRATGQAGQGFRSSA